MIIKEIKIEDFFAKQLTILELLIESYCANFNITYKQSAIICNEKLNLLSSYLEQKNAVLIGAYDGEVLAGFLWLYKHDYFGELRLHINQIIVARNYRGRGLGKRLMKESEKVAKQYKIDTIDLFVSETNQDAINLYESLNFTTERRYMKKTLLEEGNADRYRSE